MIATQAPALDILDAALEKARSQAGVSEVAFDLGTSGQRDEGLIRLADQLAETQTDAPPPVPNTVALKYMLIVVLLATLVYAFTLILALEKPYVTTLLVGEGTVVAALAGLAAYMARIYGAAVEAYDERAADWLRTEAVVRVLREMSRGSQMDAGDVVRLLEALKEIFQSES